MDIAFLVAVDPVIQSLIHFMVSTRRNYCLYICHPFLIGRTQIAGSRVGKDHYDWVVMGMVDSSGSALVFYRSLNPDDGNTRP